MSPFIRELAEELGKDITEIEKVWKEGKKLTAETFGIDESDFSKREIEYTKEIVRDILGIQREISVADFITSDKSAREFIDETVQSSDSFGIDKAVKLDTDNDDDEEDKNKDEYIPESKENEDNRVQEQDSVDVEQNISHLSKSEKDKFYNDVEEVCKQKNELNDSDFDKKIQEIAKNYNIEAIWDIMPEICPD